MRSTKMIEHLSGDPEDSVIFVHRLVEKSGGPTDPHADVLDSLVIALFSAELPYDRRREIYAAAIDRGDLVVARLLLEGPENDPKDAEPITERALIPRGRPLSLGERKSLARGPRTDSLLHLIRDPAPEVIRILLGNPHLVESDVLTIASRRPTLTTCQREILLSDKWRARYRVKRALVLNPFSPKAIGIRLAVCLSDSDLRAVSRDANLDIAIRTHAGSLLSLRRPDRE